MKDSIPALGKVVQIEEARVFLHQRESMLKSSLKILSVGLWSAMALCGFRASTLTLSS
jgi:hypothetical protein